MKNQYLAHHGVKGMKWGVRRSPEQLGHRTSGNSKASGIAGRMQQRKERKQAEQKKKQAKAFEKNYYKNWAEAYNRAADRENANLERINKKYSKYDFSDVRSEKASKELKRVYNQYCTEVGQSWTKTYKDSLLKDFGEHPTLGKKWVDRAINPIDYDAMKVKVD